MTHSLRGRLFIGLGLFIAAASVAAGIFAFRFTFNEALEMQDGMLIQIGAQVIGNDAAVTFSNSLGSTFELNVMMPVMAYNLLQSIELLASGSRVFTVRCVNGLAADADRCESSVERSLAMCTALAPAIGYDKAAEIARVAHETVRTVREVALEMSGLDKAKLDGLLDPRKQTGEER